MRDVHVQITERMYRKYKLATKRLGWVTMSSHLRAAMIEAIEKSEAITAEEEVS